MYISFVFVSIIFLLDYRTVLTVWYFFVFLLDYRTVLTVWYFLFFYLIAELFWQCFFVCFSIGLLNCSECFFVCFSIGLQNCSDSVFLFVFLFDCWTVLTVVFCLFFYWIAELFWQCFFVCFSIGLLNCSDSVFLFVFLLDYWTVLTVFFCLFFYWIAELFWQCFSIGLLNCSECFFVCFSIGLLNCSDSVFLFVFLLDCWTVLTVVFFSAFHFIHHYRCELESRSWRGVLNTTLSDKVCQVTCDRPVVISGFLHQ
jgi:hypothetical protein